MTFFKFEKFSSNLDTTPYLTISKIDMQNYGINEIYKFAYNSARNGNYQEAAVCLMQAPLQQKVFFLGFSELTYAQLTGITSANPACASRLLADPRHLNLFDDLGKVVDYLTIVPDVYPLLLKQKSILSQIRSPQALAKILQVVPTAINLFKEEGLLSKLIQSERDLETLAKEIPNNMTWLLKDFYYINLIKKSDTVMNLIIDAPQLIPLLRIVKISILMSPETEDLIQRFLELKALDKNTQAQKMLGKAYSEGIGPFYQNIEKSLKYFEMAVDKDQESADFVGEYYLKQLKSRLTNFHWESLQRIAEKIPPNSSSYKESLVLMGNTLITSIKPKAENESLEDYDVRKKEYLTAALGYLIEAFEIKKDLFVQTLLDQILAAVYQNKSFLEGSLNEETRLILIQKFRDDQAASYCSFKTCQIL